MKVKVFDTALEGGGHAIGSFTLEDLMNDWLSKHKNVDIKSVHMQECLNGQLMVLVMYEEKRNRHLQQQEFNLSEGEDPNDNPRKYRVKYFNESEYQDLSDTYARMQDAVNKFCTNHDVVNVETTQNNDEDLVTVVTYKE